MNPAADHPTPNDVHATLEQLWIYPVKSCAGLSLPVATLTETGLMHDRGWMVVDETGEFVSQRELPRMVLIQPSLEPDALVLQAPGMAPLRLPLTAVGPHRRVRVWDDEFEAFDMGEPAARWFSDCLGPGAPAAFQRLRLVRFDPAVRRLCSLKWTDGREAVTQFADGFGVLVTSTASLNELNERLARSGHAAVDMSRFRPNVVLGGDLEPHDEDRLGLWQIEADGTPVLFDNVKPCARCPIPNIDPATAEASPAVSDALQIYRQDRRLNGAVTFGMNAIPLQGVGAVLRVGQRVFADWRF